MIRFLSQTIIFPLGLLLFSPFGNAYCERIDSLFKPEWSMSFPHQGGLQWCLAFASAKIISFETGDYVNPYSLALYSQKKEAFISPTTSLKTGGYLDQTLQTAQAIGYCNKPLSQKSFQTLNKIQDHYQKVSHMKPHQLFRKTKNFIKETFNVCPRTQLIRPQRRPRLIQLSISKKQQNFQHVVQALEKGKPIAISYVKTNLSGQRYGHAAVIIGREFNPMNKKCEYLLSDSEVSCINGSFPDCQEQIYRVGEDDLIPSIFEAFFFFPKKR